MGERKNRGEKIPVTVYKLKQFALVIINQIQPWLVARNKFKIVADVINIKNINKIKLIKFSLVDTSMKREVINIINLESLDKLKDSEKILELYPSLMNGFVKPTKLYLDNNIYIIMNNDIHCWTEIVGLYVASSILQDSMKSAKKP